MSVNLDQHPADEDVLFHVGCHKTGTKWMAHSFFSAHPQLEQAAGNRMKTSRKLIRSIVLPAQGDFDAGRTRSLYAKNRRNRELYPVLSVERFGGSPLSGHYDRQLIAARIKTAFPNARILVVVRDQLALVDSIYRQLVQVGYPGSYQQLVAPSWRGPTFTLAAYKFDRVLEMYQGIFGADRVLLARHEQMRSDIGDFLAAVEAFVGADAGFRGSTDATINPSLSNKEARVLRRLNRLRKSESHPFSLVNVKRDRLVSVAQRLARVLPVSDDSLIPEKARKRIPAYFAESNARLEEMLARQSG